MKSNIKIKIAVSGLRGFPNVMGGVETHCEELYKRLPKKYDVIVYGRKGYCESRKLSTTLKVKVLYSPKKQFLETPIHTLVSILHCFVFNRVDVFHLHGIGGSIWLPLAKLFFPRVLVTHHSQNYEHQKWGRIARWVFRGGEKLALKYADTVFFVSRSLLEESKTRYPNRSSHYHFIANGFSLPEKAQQLQNIEGSFFLAVGRLVPEKGFHDLIEAFNQYEGAEKLLIAGGADFVNAYTDLIKSKASEKVIFLGQRNKAELKWLYGNCRSFVMPSYSEGLPISALEAVSCGAPIILSDIVQNLDLGFPMECYFKLGDVTALRSNLESVGTIVDKAILGKYDWEKISIEYTEYINQVVV